MTSALYDAGRQGFLDGSIDWDSDDIRVMLVLDTYTFASTHTFVSDLGAVDNGRSAALASKTTTAGVADAADTSLTATAQAACDALVIFQHTGADTSARVIAYIDTATGLPLTPATSATINITWSSTSNRIFKL